MNYVCPKCGNKLHKGAVSPGGRIRWMCRASTGSRKYCYSTTNPEAEQPRTSAGVSKKVVMPRRNLKGKNRFLITAAQNGTPVHGPFLKSLEKAANHLNAELLVVPMRYKNPTSVWTESQANEEVWAPEVQPYLYDKRKRLNRAITLLGDIKTQPTASSPLTGFEAITHAESAILAHTKLQLRTVATPQHKLPKILTTTGAVTVENYTDSKAGALGEFHHTLGAALVEISGDKFHLRQINAEKSTGEFTDLDAHYAPSAVSRVSRAQALVMGDAHVDFADPKVVEATKDMIDVLHPRYLVWHDLLDGYSVNPHHLGNPFNAIAKIRFNRADVQAEVERAFAFIEEMTPSDTESIIVPSNHDDFLTRWVIAQDWRTNPGNAQFYLETALAMVKGTQMTGAGTEYPSPFIYWGRKHFGASSKVRFLERDESFALGDIELGMHYDRGPNGARGSIRNLRRIGVKSIGGHTHSPGIDEGAMQVGTLTRLKLEYTIGPSGWLNTNAGLYDNGKRSLFNVIKGEWRLQ